MDTATTREKVNPNNKSQTSDLDTSENGDSEKGHPIVTQWKHLALDQINHLLDLTVEEVQLQLEDTLDFKHHQTCLKEAALLNYFVSGFWWAKEMHFTCEQVSGFMALLQLLLDNIREKQMPLVDNFAEFAKAIAGTWHPLPSPDSSPLFDVDQAISITDYFKSSLFQHYDLYEFIFTQPGEEHVFSTQEHVEVVNPTYFIPPLEEGMPVDVFFRYMTQVPEGEAKEALEGPPEMPQEEQQEAEFPEKGPVEEGTVDTSQEAPGQVIEDPVENVQASPLQMDGSEKLQKVQKESSSARKHRPKKNESE